MNQWWRSHSVRVRLTLWYLAAMVVVLGVYVFAVYVFVNRSLSESFDQQLRQDFVWTAASLYQTSDGTFMLNEPERLLPEEDLPWVQVWSGDGSQLLFRNSEALRQPMPVTTSLAEEGIVSIPTDTFPMRILTRRGDFLTQRGAISNARIIIQVARSEERMRAQLSDLAIILLFGLPVAVAVAGLGGYFLARRALDPIERMTEHARTMTAERLSDRLPVDNPEDEMGRLATVFNETLGRLEASFEQMRRFTADVSHELRTPLTAIRSVGEVGLRERRSEDDYRGIIGSMLEEVDRLSGLVDRLLVLSRAETGHAKLAVEAVDLRELAENVVAHLGVLAEEKQQSIHVDASGAPRCFGDRMMLRQALINLVDNAIKYSPVGGQISIRASESPAGAILDVSDNGPGIGSESPSLIFDRYYREHRTASGEVGGAGLGLSIAKWAVEVNGGELSLERGNGTGCTFRMKLPATKH
ncbi:MAG TPA: ATP-binding protein [Vicinamibacterales bacterium]|jgi:heavy metal sensor kinase